ncbi:ABC transporter permease [Streptomyces sp. NPDC047049]|uniref:ABC transporter permease n=1 Tax=Streptomyces sp. NPDC047049 TaxID=3156688 RepID=UPI003409CEAD
MLTRHYLRFELRRLRRDPKFVVLTVAMPALLYLMLSTVGGGPGAPGAGYAPDAVVMAGMACHGVLMVTVTNGVNIALDRNIGWVAQLRTTPLRATQIVLGKGVSGLLLSLLSLLAVFLIGGLAHGIPLSAAQWLEAGAITWLGSLPFALLGVALGFLVSPTTSGPAVMACVIGMSALGGLWVPARLFPESLQRVSEVLPTNHWVHLSQALLEGGASPLPGLADLAVLGGWTVGFALLAGFAFRREVTR